jgi:cell division protein FtsN
MANSKKSTKKRKKNRAIVLSGKAAFFWGLCFFLLLIWIFVLGIFVGRGFFPENMQSIVNLKTQIAKLRGIIGDKQKPESPAPEKPFEDPKLAFYEDLSTKKKAVTRRRQSPELKKTAEKPTVSKNSKAKKADIRTETTVHSSGQFAVQIASLGVEEKAKVLVAQLAAKGYPAYYYKVRLRGTPRYRVRCGNFETAEEAKKFALRFIRAEKIKGMVVRAAK